MKLKINFDVILDKIKIQIIPQKFELKLMCSMNRTEFSERISKP